MDPSTIRPARNTHSPHVVSFLFDLLLLSFASLLHAEKAYASLESVALSKASLAMYDGVHNLHCNGQSSSDLHAAIDAH